jgi:hypothetical protein
MKTKTVHNLVSIAEQYLDIMEADEGTPTEVLRFVRATLADAKKQLTQEVTQ